MTVMDLTALLLLGVASTVMGAQESVVTVRPESRVTLAGSSTFHDWSCHTSAFEARIATASRGTNGGAHHGTADVRRAVSVTIPVRSLECGNARMEADMLRALKADAHPAITWRLVSYRVDTTTGDGRFAAHATGDITVAGATRRVIIPVLAQFPADQAAVGEGSVRLRMTDFDVQPPTAFFGLLRARNEIDVSFRVLLDTTVVAALSRP